MKFIRILSISLLAIIFFNSCKQEIDIKYKPLTNLLNYDKPTNQLPETFYPVIGVWVWNNRNLQPDGYKAGIDQLSEQSPFNLITPFLRFHDKEITDSSVYNQVKLAANYAIEKNVALVPDLDIRSARRAFRSKYPEELQQMLRVQQVDLSSNKKTKVLVHGIPNHTDHYSSIPPYDAIDNSIEKVYSYQLVNNVIDPNTIKDITDKCEILSNTGDSLTINLPVAEGENIHSSVLVAFSLFYPDIFSPHILDFQREVLQQYSNIPLAGVCKDEWGFPPYFPRYQKEGIRDFWFSKNMAAEYSKRTNGRDLLNDCLLIASGISGQEVAQQVAVNHIMRMSYDRNVEIEEDFYDAVKEYYGKDAVVTVHPTWWPYPDAQEYKKNGLDWWAVKRDWAQTDELVPFGVRTALAKKWGSPIWYNMFYTENLQMQVWSSALAGGRINYLGYNTLFDKDIMRAETKVRLLNCISKSPLDCPVAVVFGHAATMNWTGNYHDDVGIDIVDTLWYSGFPADLIPTSEIENGSLKVDEEGWITYGSQRYSAVVLYHPEYESSTTNDFFNMASNGKTALYRVGEWTMDFNGSPFDGDNSLPKNMKKTDDITELYSDIMNVLKTDNISAQSPFDNLLNKRFQTLRGYDHVTYFPQNTGFSRLIDGTIIHVAGTENIAGDPIEKDFMVNDFPVSVKSNGLAAIRIDDKGKLEALAAGELQYFKGGGMEISLDSPVDVAIWRDDNGKWFGTLQGTDGMIPDELKGITKHWTFLNITVPPQMPARVRR